MTDVTGRWAEQAQYDYDTACAMLESKRFLYVLFCCQQAIEKMLKAVIIQKTGQFPPRIHDLIRLAELAEVEINNERDLFLQELITFYIQSRYPEELKALSRVNAQFASEMLAGTRETLQWLKSMIS